MDEAHKRMLVWRSIDPDYDTVCSVCSGSGTRVYGSTSTFYGGIGGRTLTTDTCNSCWGTGTTDRRGINLKIVESKLRELSSLKSSKIIIMRGIPGSGKSTYANQIKSVAELLGSTCAIHSTDDLFMVDGKYVFNFKLLKENHNKNYQNFCNSLTLGIDVIIVDNTNINFKDFNKYVLATGNVHRVIFKSMPAITLTEAISKNTHNVPLPTLTKFLNSYTVEVPQA